MCFIPPVSGVVQSSAPLVCAGELSELQIGILKQKMDGRTVVVYGDHTEFPSTQDELLEMKFSVDRVGTGGDIKLSIINPQSNLPYNLGALSVELERDSDGEHHVISGIREKTQLIKLVGLKGNQKYILKIDLQDLQIKGNLPQLPSEDEIQH